MASSLFAGKPVMRVTVGRGERAPAPRRTVPAMQTTWPSMLVPRPAAAAPLRFPFDQPGVRYRYFARNAVWDAVKLLDLAGKEVLFPAYHHGVELETLLAAGVKPIYFRVDGLMRADLEDAKRRMTANTAALYLIHYAGFPQDVDGARQLCTEKGIPMVEDCALALLSRRGRDPLGSFGDVGIFCLYKTLPVPNGGALLVREGLRDRMAKLDEPTAPGVASTTSHLVGSMLSNLELRAGPIGHVVREGMRSVGRWVKRKGNMPHVSTGTQHFNEADVGLGMSAASHVVLRNQDCAQIVERRRRNYFFLYAALRDVAPPISGELPPGTCPLFYPLPIADKASAMSRLLARGVETVDFWRLRHPLAPPVGEFPEVDKLRDTILELPVHQDLSPADMDHVAACVRELMG